MISLKIPRPSVLIINGVSGTGKTTTAQTLAKSIAGSIWIHPDGLWNTPKMKPELILERASRVVVKNADVESQLAIIDCQIRPSAINKILGDVGIYSWDMVLHSCPRKIREERLLARGWDDSDFENIENWSQLLVKETAEAGFLVVDSSVLSTGEIVNEIYNYLNAK